jgi:hypothetical protein
MDQILLQIDHSPRALAIMMPEQRVYITNEKRAVMTLTIVFPMTSISIARRTQQTRERRVYFCHRIHAHQSNASSAMCFLKPTS